MPNKPSNRCSRRWGHAWPFVSMKYVGWVNISCVIQPFRPLLLAPLAIKEKAIISSPTQHNTYKTSSINITMNAPIQSPKRQDSTSSVSSSSSHMSTNQLGPPPQPTGQAAPSTEAFLRDFTLVAEAAKRAQMAVMMRDFESCGLS
ncbi:hypothetical protein LZ32DRAFT_653408 [Colletotrichum eremochloae]|nr:hypothetical protein LZ32DRAFT_653408 [Colletotrichum eremochloae]